MAFDINRGLGKKTNIFYMIFIPTILIIGITLTILLLALPKIKLVKNKNNYYEYQTNNEGAGYAAAYTLRCFSVDAKGADIYNEIENKSEDGFVYPTDLAKVFTNRNIKVDIKSNQTIDDLKNDLDNKNPIIVLVKSNNTTTNHYITVVGYTKESIYCVDSISKNTTTKDNSRYNRIISNEDFLNIWNVSDEYKNISLILESKNE